MTDRAVPPVVEIRGGSTDPAARRAAQLSVDLAAGRLLADDFDRAGSRMRDWAGTGAVTLADGDLLESALLAPGSFARAEAAVLAATTGPDGILVEGVHWEAGAVAVRSALVLIEAQDRATGASMEAADYALGRIAGTVLGVAVLGGAPVALTASLVGVHVWSRLPGGARTTLAVGARENGADAVAWLNSHPTLERHVVNSSGGLVDGLLDGITPWPGGPPGVQPVHADPQDVLATASRFYPPEGPPAVTTHTPPALRAPGGVEDLMANLSAVNGTDAAPQPEGAIGVQRVVGPGGDTRWVVYLPGTDDMQPLHADDTARDVAGIARVMNSEDTTFSVGVLDALSRSGVGPDDPVLLVGHSQGGMQALHLLGSDTPFRVEHVVTAGSPVATSDLPADPGAGILALENAADVVPLTAGEEAAPDRRHVTVRFDDSATPGFEHDMEHYVNGGRAVDGSTDPAIREQLAALAGWLGGTDDGTDGWVVTR